MATSNTIGGMPVCSASGNVVAETAFCFAPTNTLRSSAGVPPWLSSGSLDGRELLLRCGILVTTGASLTYGPSVRLYSGGNTGPTTFTSDTAIITPTPFTIATTTRLFTLVARLSWDVTTARLNGQYAFNVDTTFTNWVTLTAGLSAGVAAALNIQFCLTGIFGTTNAGNTALLKYFELDLV